MKDNETVMKWHNPLRIKEYTLLYIMAAAMVATVFHGCGDNCIYDRYAHIDLGGWERNDTAAFGFPCKRDGIYSISIGLRANMDFPYKTISMAVERTIYPSKDTRHDTICCRIIDENGYLVGKRGISNSEIICHFEDLRLRKNDSIRIKINHCMRREIIPGLSEIGIAAAVQD